MRHGITDWNNEHRLQGKTDIPLNEEGKDMARRAAVLYKDVHFDVCYCSPLIRAVETAEILLQGREVPIVKDSRLEEMGFGVYEGIKDSFNDEKCPVNVLFKEPEKYTEPVKDGESLQELYTRTGSFLKEIAIPMSESGKDVLIVGHGAMNSSIICQIRGLSVDKFWSNGIPNCKLIKLM